MEAIQRASSSSPPERWPTPGRPSNRHEGRSTQRHPCRAYTYPLNRTAWQLLQDRLTSPYLLSKVRQEQVQAANALERRRRLSEAVRRGLLFPYPDLYPLHTSIEETKASLVIPRGGYQQRATNRISYILNCGFPRMDFPIDPDYDFSLMDTFHIPPESYLKNDYDATENVLPEQIPVFDTPMVDEPLGLNALSRTDTDLTWEGTTLNDDSFNSWVDTGKFSPKENEAIDQAGSHPGLEFGMDLPGDGFYGFPLPSEQSPSVSNDISLDINKNRKQKLIPRSPQHVVPDAEVSTPLATEDVAQLGTKSRTFKCRLCDTTFKGKVDRHIQGNMERHMNTHHRLENKNAKPFHCPLRNCKKAYRRSDGVWKHIRESHRKDPAPFQKRRRSPSYNS